MRVTFAIVVFNLLFVVSTFAQQQPISVIIRPTLLKKGAVPAGGLLLTANALSFLQCTHLCTQNNYCWRFSYGDGTCNLYEPVHPMPNPEFLDLEGYTTYQARKKIFKVIKGPYTQEAGGQQCKSRFGSRLACITDMESLQLYTATHMQNRKDHSGCSYIRVHFGLRPNGTSGLFQWPNGEIIDVIKGIGFQNWRPGKPPVLYKTKDVVVVTGVCRETMFWYEADVQKTVYPVCEIP